MSFSRFRSLRARMLATICLCAVVFFGLVQTSQAGPLVSGTSIGNDGVPANVPGPPFGALLADSGYLPYTFAVATGSPKVKGTGFVREIVISDASNPLGGLTFMYQVEVTKQDVGRVSLTDFTGFLTDASAVTTVIQNPLNPIGTLPWVPNTPGGLVKGLLPISRSVDGSTVSFDFDGTTLTAGNVSEVMIIRTNAHAFTDGNIAVQDGSNANIAVLGPFAPVPEPTSMALLGIGIMGMAGYGWRRRRLERKQDAMAPTV